MTGIGWTRVGLVAAWVAAASAVGCGSSQRPDCAQRALGSPSDDGDGRKQSTSCTRRSD